MPPRMRPSVGPSPRAWRAAATLLLIGWCLVGVREFGRAMRGPAGLFVNRPPGTEGAVGMPLAGAEVVTTFRAMLEDARDSRPWLLVLPGETPPFVKTYVRYQLAHIAYPRRVDVATPDEVRRLEDDVHIVAPAGLAPRGGWGVVEERNGLLRYERTGS